jgi:hypothetical protein
MRRDGQGRGDRAFSRAAFLTHKRDCPHGLRRSNLKGPPRFGLQSGAKN